MPTDREQTQGEHGKSVQHQPSNPYSERIFDESTGTPSVERKALDLLIQASRTDPKLRAAVLEVEKWIARLIDSVAAAEQAVDEIQADRDDDYSAATTPRFVALHDGDIASGVLDKRRGEVLPFWIEQKKDGAKWAERIAAALNATGKEYR